jgi:hypothetical protein
MQAFLMERFRGVEHHTRHGSLVSRDIGPDCGIRDITKDWHSIFAHQGFVSRFIAIR